VTSAAPFEGFSCTVGAEWIDYNGHMTDSAYGVVCAAANEEVLDALGVGAAYRDRTGCSMYTVESRLRYLVEVAGGTVLRARTTLVDADSKRLLLHTSVLDEQGPEVLTGEYLFLHVDQGSGAVVPFPPDRSAAIESVQLAHRDLPRPAHLGQGVVAARRSTG
jgi:acyl-CoA thioester hydrolase